MLRQRQQGVPHTRIVQRVGQTTDLQPILSRIDRTRDIQPQGKRLPTSGLGRWNGIDREKKGEGRADHPSDPFSPGGPSFGATEEGTSRTGRRA